VTVTEGAGGERDVGVSIYFRIISVVIPYIGSEVVAKLRGEVLVDDDVLIFGDVDSTSFLEDFFIGPGWVLGVDEAGMTIVITDEQGVEHAQGTVFTYSGITADEDLVGLEYLASGLDKGGIQQGRNRYHAISLSPRGRTIDAAVRGGGIRREEAEKVELGPRIGGHIHVIESQQATEGSSAQGRTLGAVDRVDGIQIQPGRRVVGYLGNAVDNIGLRGLSAKLRFGLSRSTDVDEGQIGRICVDICEDVAETGVGSTELGNFFFCFGNFLPVIKLRNCNLVWVVQCGGINKAVVLQVMVYELTEHRSKQGVRDVVVQQRGIRSTDGVGNHTLVGSLRIGDRAVVGGILGTVRATTIKGSRRAK